MLQNWQWQLGALAIFFAWMSLVLFIQKIPKFGIYVVMFIDVFSTFINFFPVFFLFIIAFALAFYALLQNQVSIYMCKCFGFLLGVTIDCLNVPNYGPVNTWSQ